MNMWVWFVDAEKWRIIDTQRVWGTIKPEELSVCRGDRIVFYVKEDSAFCGVFEVASEWHEPSAEWTYPAKYNPADIKEVDLKPITGIARLDDVISRLGFIEKKDEHVIYLAPIVKNGPGNFGKPIPIQDYDTILEEMARTRKMLSDK